MRNAFTPALGLALTFTLFAAPACDHEEPEPGGETGSATERLHAQAPARVPSPPPKAFEHHPANGPGPVSPDARHSFDKLVELLGEKYVDGSLSEDELWTGAMEGVIARLEQHPKAEINALLTPEELGRLLEGTHGAVVGVGIMIEVVADVLMVKAVIPGGPAEQAGLQAGDRILSVDGTRLKDVPLDESVGMIRGEEGSMVELFVQRDTEEWTVEVERGVVKVPGVDSLMLEDGVGLLHVSSFSKNTPAEVDEHLRGLQDEGMTRLVLDLRNNPGGLLETAIETADHFLPTGLRIVTIRGTEGEEHRNAEQQDSWESVPMVVLVGPHSASGAEILAGALADNDRAILVGEPTFGKGTVEAVHELDNGWAFKLSTARFYSPDGHSPLDGGVMPDFVVAGLDDKQAFEAEVLLADPQVRAALKLLEE